MCLADGRSRQYVYGVIWFSWSSRVSWISICIIWTSHLIHFIAVIWVCALPSLFNSRFLESRVSYMSFTSLSTVQGQHCARWSADRRTAWPRQGDTWKADSMGSKPLWSTIAYGAPSAASLSVHNSPRESEMGQNRDRCVFFFFIAFLLLPSVTWGFL